MSTPSPSKVWLKEKTEPTSLDEVEEEISTSYSRKYLFRRPHPLQYEKDGEGQFAASEDLESIVPVTNSNTQSSSQEVKHGKSHGGTTNVKESRLLEAKITERQRRSQ
jgi:hypothetical protein